MQKGAVKRRADHLDSGENSIDADEDLTTAEQEHDHQRDSPTLRQPTQATARFRRRQRGRGQRDREHAPHRQRSFDTNLLVEEEEPISIVMSREGDRMFHMAEDVALG